LPWSLLGAVVGLLAFRSIMTPYRCYLPEAPEKPRARQGWPRARPPPHRLPQRAARHPGPLGRPPHPRRPRRSHPGAPVSPSRRSYLPLHCASECSSHFRCAHIFFASDDLRQHPPFTTLGQNTRCVPRIWAKCKPRDFPHPSRANPPPGCESSGLRWRHVTIFVPPPIQRPPRRRPHDGADACPAAAAVRRIRPPRPAPGWPDPPPPYAGRRPPPEGCSALPPRR